MRDEILELAEQHRRDGETEDEALARLIDEALALFASFDGRPDA